jgi:hypothetical protein
MESRIREAADKLGVFERMYLIRLVDRYGLREGFTRFFNDYERMTALRPPEIEETNIGPDWEPIRSSGGNMFKSYAMWKVFGSGRSLRRLLSQS